MLILTGLLDIHASVERTFFYHLGIGRLRAEVTDGCGGGKQFSWKRKPFFKIYFHM